MGKVVNWTRKEKGDFSGWFIQGRAKRKKKNVSHEEIKNSSKQFQQLMWMTVSEHSSHFEWKEKGIKTRFLFHEEMKWMTPIDKLLTTNRKRGRTLTRSMIELLSYLPPIPLSLSLSISIFILVYFFLLLKLPQRDFKQDHLSCMQI